MKLIFLVHTAAAASDIPVEVLSQFQEVSGVGNKPQGYGSPLYDDEPVWDKEFHLNPSTHRVTRRGDTMYLPKERAVEDRLQTVGFENSGPAPTRAVQLRRGTKHPSKHKYRSQTICHSPPCESDHAVNAPLTDEQIADGWYEAYRKATVGADWIPYFPDQVQYKRIKSILALTQPGRDGDEWVARRYNLPFVWKERDWEEQEAEQAAIRTRLKITDDAYPTGFASGDPLEAASYQGSSKKPPRPFTSRHPVTYKEDTRTEEDAQKFATAWHTSVADDQARDDANEDAK